MAKSYINITPTDYEVLALCREVPFIDVELAHKVFYSSHKLPDYARKKLTLLERDQLIKGWMVPGQKKLYTLTKQGGQFLKMVSEDIKGKYFKPDFSQEMVFTSRINPPAITHTRKLIDLLLKMRAFNFFDAVFLFDHLQGKDAYTKNRPDIIMSKGGHSIYLEYENSSKAPQSYYERFQNFFKDSSKLVLVLYVCSERWISDRILRYISEFRAGKNAQKFKDHEIKESERIYISGPEMTFKNCLDKTLTLEQIMERLK
jgi:hypothetical protein